MREELRRLVEQAETELAKPKRGNDEQCRNGHRRTVWNTRWDNRGWRYCTDCDHENGARYRSRKRATR